MSGRRCQAGLDVSMPVLCYYAADPAGRPCCAVTAEVVIGSVALCGACEQTRSSLGKGAVARRLPAVAAVDVLAWVADADAAALLAQARLAGAVRRARLRGHSGAEIAGRLGVTRQAAQQRFGRAAGR